MSNRIIVLLIIFSLSYGVYLGYSLCKRINQPPQMEALELSAAVDCADEADLMLRVMDYLEASPDGEDNQWIANKLRTQIETYPTRCLNVNVSPETLEGVCADRNENDWCVMMTR